MNTAPIVIATDWGEASIAITVVAFVGALALVALWQIASIIKKGMDLRHDRASHTEQGRDTDPPSPGAR